MRPVWNVTRGTRLTTYALRAEHEQRRGAAPGLMIEVGDALLAVFPGVPWEAV